MTDETQRGSSETAKIFAYFAPLTLLVYLVLPHNYLVDIATSYMLKDRLHASVSEVSMFRLLTAIPVYLSFVFGMARDIWNPFGLRDRGYFLIFAPVTAIIFVWLALSSLSYAGLFLGVIVAMATFRFVSAAHQGLIALVGQEKLMSGRLAALWQIFNLTPSLAGAAAAGWIAVHLKPQPAFLIIAALTLVIAIFGLWKPSAVFGGTYNRPAARTPANLRDDIGRLVRHRPAWLAVLIMFLFQFAPGMNTPLQFYLTNVLHASDAAYGDFNAIFLAAFLPMLFLYGFLCRKFSLRTLLWAGTIITVPQIMPLAFIHSADMALLLAFPIGAMGGIAAAAYLDLAMRACPPGLQGTLMMMVDGVFILSMRGGDLLGAKIYASSPAHGFLYCALTTTAVYALILLVLPFIPKELIATRDGEASAATEVAAGASPAAAQAALG